MSRRPRSRTARWASALPAAACALALAFAALAEIPFAAERHALTLEPAAMPVRLEKATFFDDGRVFAWVWRNSTREALYPRLRVFVFDERGRFAGSLQRCIAAPLQPGTRAQVRIELEIDGVTARHRFVALVEEVRSSERIWRVDRDGRALVEAARRAVKAEDAAISVVQEPNAGGDLVCPCDCEAAEARGREGCGDARLAAFTCTPAFFPGGCSLGYSCR